MKSSHLTYWMPFFAMVRAEIMRIARIWRQTLFPPMMTVSLYYIVFGKIIGERIGNLSGVSYIDFIAPGLILMNVIMSSYGNVVTSFYGARFGKSIEELLIAPITANMMLMGYLFGGIIRGLIVGLLITIVTLFFTTINIAHIGFVLLVALEAAMLFALIGFLNGLYAESFDDTTVIPSFVLSPLIYLGGVFFSISLLPEPWQTIASFNPIVYLITAFRFGFLGISDINPYLAILFVTLMNAGLYWFCWRCLVRGVGIRS